MLDFVSKKRENRIISGQYNLYEYINTWKINKLICTPETHNEKTFHDWLTLAKKIHNYSTTVDDIDYQYLCKKGKKFLELGIKDRNKIPYIRCDDIRIYDYEFYTKTYNDPDYLFTTNANLISGVLRMIYKEFSIGLELDRYDAVMIAQKILQFTCLWEKGLRLDLDLVFLKNLLKNLSKSMTIPIGRYNNKFDNITPLRLDPNKKLYFAYGSNISKDQMKDRCPNSTIAGLSTISNFEFFINQRGYASIKPSLGKSCSGLLWNIADQDWERLDRYEGVSRNFYKRIKTKLKIKNDILDCEIYVANNNKKGDPNFGYLENIISSAKECISESLTELNSRWADTEEKYLIDDWKKHPDNWIKELLTHRRI